MERSTRSIAAKIAALHKMTEAAGCTPSEAANAAVLAAQLMETHSIATAQVELAAGAERLTGYGAERHEIGNANWKRVLCGVIARANLCRAVLIGSKVEIVGHRDNVAVAFETLTWMFETVDNMAHYAWKNEGRFSNPRGAGAAQAVGWKNSYRIGCVSEIGRRLVAEARARREQATTSTALVVIEERVLEVFRQLHPRTTRSSFSGSSNGDGGSYGRRDGAAMSLSRTHNVAGPRPRIG